MAAANRFKTAFFDLAVRIVDGSPSNEAGDVLPAARPHDPGRVRSFRAIALADKPLFGLPAHCVLSVRRRGDDALQVLQHSPRDVTPMARERPRQPSSGTVSSTVLAPPR